MSERRALESLVRTTERRIAAMRSLRISPISWGMALVLYHLCQSAPSATILIVVLVAVPVCVFFWPQDSRDTVKRLDRAAELNEELQCAWDHRTKSDIFVLAQRRQALQRYAARLNRLPVPWPHPAWSVALVLWSIPLFSDGESTALAEEETRSGIVLESDAKTSSSSQELDGMPSAESKRRRPFKVDLTVRNVDEESQKSDAQDVTESAGVGAKVGSVSSGPSTVELIALSEPMDRNPPAQPVGAEINNLLPPRTPRDEDLILADPARPYPVRYHGVIRQWFKEKKRE